MAADKYTREGVTTVGNRITIVGKRKRILVGNRSLRIWAG
jgi:hypothetical protein